MYNYYRQQPYQTRLATYQPQMPIQQGLKGRPVSSVEEARAASIDFDGSIFYFPDVANNCIYTKQINMDGSASLNVYELRKMPLQNMPVNIDTASFITRDEFEQVIARLRSDLFPQKNLTQF
jgi:hypothetical protein